MNTPAPFAFALAVLGTTVLSGCTPTGADPAAAAPPVAPTAPESYPDPADKLELTEAQWKGRLTPEQFYILRQDGTERPHSSPLNKIKHDATPGDFACAGCDNLLFQTAHKYDSGTGWPSFDRPAPGSEADSEVGGADRIVEAPDFSAFMQRTEVRCARCDGHLGHVFEDGPRDTTGLRYCINGDALVFYAEGEQKSSP